MSLELHLIGVHHFDEEGFDRLMKFFDHLKPDFIALELPEDLLPFLVGGDRFEVSAANEYKLQQVWANRDVEIVPVNLPLHEYQEGRERVHEVESSLNEEVLEGLKRQKWGADTYLLYNSVIPEEIKPLLTAHVDSMREVDQHISTKLRKIDGKTVLPIGAVHIFGSYSPNLYERLSDLSPQVYHLGEADKIQAPVEVK